MKLAFSTYVCLQATNLRDIGLTISPIQRGMARETAGDQKRAGSVLLAQVQDSSRAKKIFLPAHKNNLSVLQISPYYR